MKIAIVTADTARAVGLRWILSHYFDLEAVVVEVDDAMPAMLDEVETSATVYIVDADVCCSMSDFFIPRRQRAIIIGISPGMFAMHQSEGDMVEELRRRLDTMSVVAVEQTAPGLSQREVEVLRHIALGHLNKEIADALGISINTVLSHRKNITAKLGIRSASGLSVYAMMNGYMSSSELH
jgi:DNA-binding CsgD family transcriptional regulator